MSVYVISDTHFGHNNIIKFREGFATWEEHDQYIKESILSVVGKRDSLYILGDVCVDRKGWHNVVDISQNVEHLHIVLGNHDMERKQAPSLQDYVDICRGVYGLRKYKGMWLSHAPVHADELRGSINVHGHVHANSVPDERYFNACCEAVGYKPANLKDIEELLRGS